MTAEQEKTIQAFEREVKLHINDVLFREGYLTEQLFNKVKKQLLQSGV